MLLFLFSFYLHYYLFNCDEHGINAKFNESLIIDKHHQNLLEVNAFIKNVQNKVHEKSVLINGGYKNYRTRDKELVHDNITNHWKSKALRIDQTDQNLKGNEHLPAVFHPSPRYDPAGERQGLLHWLPPVFPGFKIPLPPFVIPRSSSPNPKALLPFKNPRQRPRIPYPGYPLKPMNSRYPRLLPGFLSDYRYQNIYLRPPAPYLPSPSYTPGPYRPTGLPFHYAASYYLQNNPHLINPVHPTISPPISDPELESSSKTPPPVTIPSSTIGYNAKIWLQEIAPYTPENEELKKPSKDQSSPHHSEETTVSITNETSKTNGYWFSTETANTGQLFNEDEHGLLYVTLPKKDGISDQIPNDPDQNWTSTIGGDVQHENITVQKTLSPSPQQHYLDVMEELNEGYMMVFMIELCRIIALKDRWEVRQVVHHTEIIYNSLWDSGRLAWIGDPLETVIWKLSIIMSGRDINLVRTYASMMFHMLLQRKQTLSAEVNFIIDETDLFYNDDEGDRLLYSLKQFNDYPKTPKSSYWICESLIESFLLPFRRLSGTRRRQRLIDSINKALKERFPQLLSQHREATLASTASPKEGPQPKKRKRKRHHLLHKRKRKRKRHHIPEYNNENTYGKRFIQVTDYKNLILTTLTAVTSDQPRFRATTRKSYRKKIKPTTAYFNLY